MWCAWTVIEYRASTDAPGGKAVIAAPRAFPVFPELFFPITIPFPTFPLHPRPSDLPSSPSILAPARVHSFSVFHSANRRFMAWLRQINCFVSMCVYTFFSRSPFRSRFSARRYLFRISCSQFAAFRLLIGEKSLMCVLRTHDMTTRIVFQACLN